MSGQGELAVRVLLAVASRELERRLTRELAAAGIAIGARCLDGPSLLERAAEPGIDVVLAAADLHRLSGGALLALRERGLPVVLLAAAADDAARLSTLGRVLPAASPGAIVVAALRQAASPGAPFAGPEEARACADAGAAAVPPAEEGAGRVVAVTSGKGAPGKTTLAIALAALLAERGPDVVLLDADLRGGNVAPSLDLDPRRGLVGLAAGGRLADELQPGPGFSVLAGVERPALAAGLREETLRTVIGALRERFGTVVVDLGVPPEAGPLRAGGELLLVTGADLVSLWNARTALPAIREQAGAAALSVVVNRREGREHYAPGEVERALGVPVRGVVREERESARRAIAQQIPLPGAGGKVLADLHALAAALAAPAAAAPGQTLPAAAAPAPGLLGALR